MANLGLPALKTMLAAPSVQEQFTNSLKEGKDTFIASIIDLYGSDPSLAQCDNGLIVKECLRAATMHLPINRALGYAYVVVFNNKVKVEYTDEKGLKQYKYETQKTPTFILSYKGLIQLALRTRIYTNIHADIIYEGELIESDKLTGEIKLDAKQRISDKVIGYFAHFETVYGMKKTFFMSLEQVARFAKMYAPTVKFTKEITVESLMALAGLPPRGNGWTGDFDNMAKKTCLRQLLERYGELSTEIQTAIIAEKSATISADETATEETVKIEDIKYVDIAEQPAEVAEPKADDKAKVDDVKLDF